MLASPAGAGQTLGMGAGGGKFHPRESQTQSKDIYIKCFLSFAHVNAFISQSSQRFLMSFTDRIPDPPDSGTFKHNEK